MRLRSLLPLLLLCALPLSEALAQNYYRWVDDEGEVHYGQSVPPEFADYGYARLAPDGTVLERIEPALSPEEIAERRRQRAEQERIEAAERNQETKDRMLLATYGSESQLRNAMDMQMQGIESQKASTRQALALVERRFEDQIGRAARLNRAGRAVPDSLQTSIEQTRAELRRMRAELERLEERRQRTRERFMADIERYRELTGSRNGSDGG